MAYSDLLLSEQINYTLQMVAHSEFNENIRHFYAFKIFRLKFQIFIKFFEYLKLIHTHFDDGILISWFIYLFVNCNLSSQPQVKVIKSFAIFSFLFHFVKFQNMTKFRKNCVKDQNKLLKERHKFVKGFCSKTCINSPLIIKYTPLFVTF